MIRSVWHRDARHVRMRLGAALCLLIVMRVLVVPAAAAPGGVFCLWSGQAAPFGDLAGTDGTEARDPCPWLGLAALDLPEAGPPAPAPVLAPAALAAWQDAHLIAGRLSQTRPTARAPPASP